MEQVGTGGAGSLVTSAIVKTMASLSSVAAFISASARSLLNWLNSSHSCSVVELWWQEILRRVGSKVPLPGSCLLEKQDPSTNTTDSSLRGRGRLRHLWAVVRNGVAWHTGEAMPQARLLRSLERSVFEGKSRVRGDI